MLAGSADELFFRGAIQTRLRSRWHPTTAILVSSLLFGLIHLERPRFSATDVSLSKVV